VFAEGGIVEDEVRAGLFDGAEIRVSFVNWQDPDGHGEIRLRRGTLGETRLTPQGYFHAELRGLSQPLAQSTLEVFSPNCRADLGDHRCKFPIEPPELERDQAVSEGAFYRVATAAGTGSARYEDRIYEVIDAGTTASSQPSYDTTIGATTADGSAVLKSHDTRVGGELVDGTGEVPLAEDSEQYDLEILFGNAVVRVIGGLTSPSYVYTSADQATDFPGFVAQGLSNPGFETGDLSGWTVESGGTWTVDNAHESLSGGHTGSWFVRSTGDGVLAQTVDVSSIAPQIDLGEAQACTRPTGQASAFPRTTAPRSRPLPAAIRTSPPGSRTSPTRSRS
jgi:hypothetical protein